MSSQITIKRGTATLAVVNPISGSAVNRQLMGVEALTLQFDSPTYIGIQAGDYVVINGVTYTNNIFPTIKKTSTHAYNYSIEFESPVYQLLKTMFLFYDSNNNVQSGVFSAITNPHGFASLLVLNLNRDDTGWTIGGTISAPAVGIDIFQNISFSNESCTSAVNKIATAYATEWYVVGKQIFLQQKLNPKNVVLSYGAGIVSIQQSPNTNSQLVTRLYVLGGTNNLPTGYGSQYVTPGFSALHMPGGATHLDSNVAQYGIYEAIKTFDKISPQAQGSITGVTDYLDFSDTSLTFNPFTQTVPGLTPQINFLTGQLAGYSFNITAFNASTSTFTIAVNATEKSIQIPSQYLSASVGDLYTFTNIMMPASYVTTAEQALQTAATNYLALNSTPRWAYDLTLDGNYLAANGITFDSGDQITIVDSPMSLNVAIRVMGVTFGVLYGDTYKLTLGDSVQPTVAERIYAATDAAVQTAQSLSNNALGISHSVQGIAQSTQTAAQAAATSAANAAYSASTANSASTAANQAAQQAIQIANGASSTAATASSTATSAASTASAANTAASNAATAAQAATTNMQYITTALRTSVDGGLVTTAVLEVGNDGQINAGLNGTGTSDGDVRFWAGSSFGNRASAPFRVENNGVAFMTSATIQNGCIIGDYIIDGNGGLTDSSATAFIKMTDTPNDPYASVRIILGVSGTLQTGQGNYMLGGIALIENGRYSSSTSVYNTALTVSAHGAQGGNQALYVAQGDIVINGGGRLVFNTNGGSSPQIICTPPTFTLGDAYQIVCWHKPTGSFQLHPGLTTA